MGFVHRLATLERFPAKWIPVRMKKTRQIEDKNFLRSDLIGTKEVLGLREVARNANIYFLNLA
jgi:hypothetical protein